jgi:glucose/arabinose dehydrogenase
MLIAERGGRIRIMRGGALNREAALTLDEVMTANGNGVGAIAIDPQFNRSRFVYIIYTASSASGDPVFRLVRFREVNDALAERAVLLDAVPRRDAGSRIASLRTRWKLYAAFDDGGDARRIGDLSSCNGKILRLNADGRHRRCPAARPCLPKAFRSPRGSTGIERRRALDRGANPAGRRSRRAVARIPPAPSSHGAVGGRTSGTAPRGHDRGDRDLSRRSLP